MVDGPVKETSFFQGFVLAAATTLFGFFISAGRLVDQTSFKGVEDVFANFPRQASTLLNKDRVLG